MYGWLTQLYIAVLPWCVQNILFLYVLCICTIYNLNINWITKLWCMMKIMINKIWGQNRGGTDPNWHLNFLMHLKLATFPCRASVLYKKVTFFFFFTWWKCTSLNAYRKSQLQIHYVFHGIDNLMNSALLEVERLWYSWSAAALERVFVTGSLYWMEVMAVRLAAVSASVRGVVFREMKGNLSTKTLREECVRECLSRISQSSVCLLFIWRHSLFFLSFFFLHHFSISSSSWKEMTVF